MAGKTFAPTDMDTRIGKLIAIMRTRQGLTQKDLAEKLGITFQQVQKYEVADNRISASRLYQIAQILELPVATLYAEADSPIMHDKSMRDFLQVIFSLSDTDRKLVFQIVQRLKG